MYKYLLENAGDINWMAIFALVTFVAIFLIGTITVLRRDAGFIDRMSRLPLEDSNTLTSENADHHEK